VPGSVTVTGEACPGHDSRRREWRHLGTCRYRTITAAEVPCIDRPEHDVHLAVVLWAELGSSFTALFEASAIDWLCEVSASAVARQLGLNWSVIDGIMCRAVDRGMARRDDGVIRFRIGVDETSFCKRHEYVTVVIDLDRGCVVHVADDRRKGSLEACHDGLTAEQWAGVESVSMTCGRHTSTPRWRGFPTPARIAFDRFHVARALGDAVDRVRWQEHGRLQQQGDTRLTGSGYTWQTSPRKMNRKQKRSFRALSDSSL